MTLGFGRTSRTSRCAGTLLIAAAALMPTASASAQRLIVEVRDSVLQSGIAGALVTATERTTGRQVFGITNAAGRALLPLSGSGVWSTAVRRIGILPSRAPAVAVSDGQTVSIAVRTTAAQFRLPAVLVRAAAPSCAVAPAGEGRAAVLWEQMTLALRGTTASTTVLPSRDAMHVTVFERELTRDRTRRSERTIREGPGVDRPFFATHPDTLVARGYVHRDATGGLQYYAPDETVLLSDGFIRTHCFDAPPSQGDTALAELRFTPVRGRSLPDVAGTAFIDARTGELRRIAFRYVNVDRLFEGRRPDAGGDVTLQSLSDGRWLVSGWTIRMPTYMGVPGRVERLLFGYREVGGTIRLLPNDSSSGALRADFTLSPVDSLPPAAISERASGQRRTSAVDIEHRSGFTMRRRGGPGIFLDSTELARRPARTALELLQGVAGITLITTPDDSSGVPAEADPDLRREWRAGAELPMMPTGTGDGGTTTVCLVKVYLDGRRAALAQLVALPAREVVALEFYRLPRDVPAAYRREGNRCGTAIFWSLAQR